MTTGIGSSGRFCWYAKPLSTVTRALNPPSAAIRESSQEFPVLATRPTHLLCGASFE